ncbi:MAG: hypothetical protein AAGJ50_04105, partial [Pseudomonadota bacterium]
YEIDVLLHINPTYAAIGTELETAFHENRFSPPDLNAFVSYLRTIAPERVKLHCGLNDEGLAVPGGSFNTSANAAAIAQLVSFNRYGTLSA